MESHKNSFCSNTNGVIDADITEAEAEADDDNDNDDDDDDDDDVDFLLSVFIVLAMYYTNCFFFGFFGTGGYIISFSTQNHNMT